MKKHEEARPSLLDLFSAPGDKRRGVFGLVCGLSADEQFMDNVLERFSGRSKSQRLHNGHFSLALFIDIHNKPLYGLPGLTNPSPSRNISAKTRQMHAKVALLGFGESASGMPDYYRLIVSTGNWTKESINNQVNIVWHCDYDLNDQDSKSQEAADMLEVASFWAQLLGINTGKAGYYQVDGPVKDRISAFLSTLVAAVPTPSRKYSPRFISNIFGSSPKRVGDFGGFKGKAASDSIFQPDSMGAQVIQRFIKSRLRRNSIICGSGFFENPDVENKCKPPKVLTELIALLVENEILVKVPFVHGKRLRHQRIIINPGTSGAAGHWIKNTKDADLDGWSVRTPRHPDLNIDKPKFHAKYIFVGNENNSSLTSGMLYLGSGNLSKRGFALSPGTGGNVEAGVVVDVERHDSIKELAPKLGFDDDTDLTSEDIPDEIESEESEQDARVTQLPPPIVSCFWNPISSKLSWMWTDATDYRNVMLHGQEIAPSVTELILPGEKQDFSLGARITAQIEDKACDWMIPVFSEGGTFCLPPITPKTGQEIVDALAAFPLYSCEDDEPDEDEGQEMTEDIVTGQHDDFSDLRAELDRFPLHLATTLIETIADQNQRISYGQLPDWAAHLRRTLKEEMKPEMKAQLMALGFDIFNPLVRAEGFAPKQSSETIDSVAFQAQLKIYNDTIKQIAEDWRAHAEKVVPTLLS